MATEAFNREQLGELRGFVRGFARLQQALTIGLYNYDVLLLPVTERVEATLQEHFDALGQKLTPPVKHWEIRLDKLSPWQQTFEKALRSWLLSDDELKTFYEQKRAHDPRPGEVHVGTNDVARAFREELESFLGGGKHTVWEVTLHALTGASDRYLATLDDHFVFELDGAVLLVTFAMTR